MTAVESSVCVRGAGGGCIGTDPLAAMGGGQEEESVWLPAGMSPLTPSSHAAKGTCSLSLSPLKGDPEPRGPVFQTLRGKRQHHGAHQLSAELTEPLGVGKGPLRLRPNLCHAIELLKWLFYFPEGQGLRQPTRMNGNILTPPLCPGSSWANQSIGCPLPHRPRAPREELEPCFPPLFTHLWTHRHVQRTKGGGSKCQTRWCVHRKNTTCLPRPQVMPSKIPILSPVIFMMPSEEGSVMSVIPTQPASVRDVSPKRSPCFLPAHPPVSPQQPVLLLHSTCPPESTAGTPPAPRPTADSL